MTSLAYQWIYILLYLRINLIPFSVSCLEKALCNIQYVLLALLYFNPLYSDSIICNRENEGQWKCKR